MPFRLLNLSDEVLLLICSFLTIHTGLLEARLSCAKLYATSYDTFFEDLEFRLPEVVNDKWKGMQFMPAGIAKTKTITILNESQNVDGYHYTNTVTRRGTYRIFRWQLLETAAAASRQEFSKSALLRGVTFNNTVRLGRDQLTSFRWRHAITLDILDLQQILVEHGGSIERLEVSMITPPEAAKCTAFSSALAISGLSKLRSLTYNGLSHTEPIPQNRPERGGRFRMLRPIFRLVHKNLDELILSQDHCISQIGKTPLINGRVFQDWFCNLDELWTDVNGRASISSVNLELARLELGGFRVAALFNDSTVNTVPRVRVSLPHLRRLVLNDCDELVPLLSELTVRSNEVRFTELAFRIYEELEKPDQAEYDSVELALQSFLVSFRGLELLSVLWDGLRSPCTRTLSEVLAHHSRTLEAYSFADRQDWDDADHDLYLSHIKEPRPTSVYTKILNKQKPAIREYGLVMPRHMKDIDYQGLRLLSQFHTTLRTLHIRNFPLLNSVDDYFWRGSDGQQFSQQGIEKAQEFAEMVALPYYALPTSVNQNDPEVARTIREWYLNDLADLHATKRDETLCIPKLNSLHWSKHPIPKRDFIREVMQQRAEVDPSFAALLKRVLDGANPSSSDWYDYHAYKNIISTTLGYTQPQRDTKPKLKLLIIGEWRYRDQLNLTGPRTYEPAPWNSATRTLRPVPQQSSGATRSEYDIIDDEDFDSDDYDGLIQSHGLFRPGFHREYDTCLLPIFYKIDWEVQKDERDNKYRWRARATPMERHTLEGYERLPDTRLLDFAWQN